MKFENIEEDFALRLQLLVVNIGTECLKNVFDKHVPPSDLSTKLFNLKSQIKKKNYITPDQLSVLYPSTKPVESSDFDITLLVALIRDLCNVEKDDSEKSMWKITDNTKMIVTSVVADVVRLRNIRNEVYLIIH